MRSTRIIGGMLLAMVMMQACEKNETSAPEPTLVQKTVSNIPADTIVALINGQPVGAGKFSFFSLENNALVPSSDSNSLKWDIAMRGTTIITNGGNSGPGLGGAFVYVGTFDELKTIPTDSVFRKDNAPVSYAIPLGSTSYLDHSDHTHTRPRSGHQNCLWTVCQSRDPELLQGWSDPRCQCLRRR